MRRVGVSHCGTVTRSWDACPVRTHCALPACQRQPDGNVGKAKPPVRSCIFKPRDDIKTFIWPPELRNRPLLGHFWPAIGRRRDRPRALEDGGKTAESHLRASLTCLLFGRGGRVESAGGFALYARCPSPRLVVAAGVFLFVALNLQSALIRDATRMHELCCCVCCHRYYHRRPGNTACGYRIRLSFYDCYHSDCCLHERSMLEFTHVSCISPVRLCISCLSARCIADKIVRRVVRPRLSCWQGAAVRSPGAKRV